MQEENSLFDLRNGGPRRRCKATEKPLTQETITLNEEGKLESSILKDFAKNITNCSNSKSFCEDSSGYPTEEVDKLLSSHLQQEYFKDVLGEHTEKACSHTTEATIGNVITGGIIIRKPNFTFSSNLQARNM